MESWCEALDIVEPIESVSVTTASIQIPCLLAVHAPRTVTDGWPESVHSAVGSIVHSLIEELAALPAERELLINSPAASQTRLQESMAKNGIDTQQLGNLWQSCLRTLRRALEAIPHGYEAISQECGNRSRDAHASQPYVSRSSTEGWACDVELGVRGKFDFRLVLDTEVRVDDFKTGCVIGSPEKLRKWHRQVAIYTLISFRLEPEKRHTARIVAADGIFEVNTSIEYLRELEAELINQKAQWPKLPTAAEELATTCSMCRQCRARHACPVYRLTTPWINDSNIDTIDHPIWSWDVWGTVVRTSTSGPQHAMVLMTQTGRVIVNGFDPSADVSELCLGSRVGIFGVRQDRNYTESRPVFRAHQHGRHAKTRILLAQ